MRRLSLVCWILGAMVLLLAPAASADDACNPEFRRWLAACSAGHGVDLAADHCAEGVAVVQASLDGVSSRLEIALPAAAARSFDHVRGYGLSPIGSYTDWSEAPAPVHRSFDAVRACLAERLPVFRADAESPRSAAPIGRTTLAFATLAAWVVLVTSGIRKGTRRAEVLLAVSAAMVGVVFRHVALGAAFFHQNGHGADWVELALCRPSDYGPGYTSLFRLPAQWAGVSAERGVFVAQEVLASLAAIAMYAVGRSVCASRAIAWSAAAAIGIEPLLSRLARSESYYACILWLFLLASAALLAPGLRIRRHEPRAIAGAAVGGVLLGIAITVHPVAWIPAALVPAVVFLRRGSWRATLRLGLVTAAVVAVCVAAVAAKPAIDVLRGPLGQQWGGSAPRGSQLVSTALLIVVPWAIAMAIPRRVAAWIFPVVLAVVASEIDRRTNLFGPRSTLAYARAWRWLYAVAPIAGALSVVARVEMHLRRRLPAKVGPALVPAAIVLFGVIHSGATFTRSTTLPTDALEATRFAPVLHSLPPESRVVYLSAAGLMVQELPLYRCEVDSARRETVSLDQGPRQLVPGEYWFRAATCSSSMGRRLCDEIEQRAVLRPIRVERFPARPSLDHLPYDSREVVSGLFHVEAIRQP